MTASTEFRFTFSDKFSAVPKNNIHETTIAWLWWMIDRGEDNSMFLDHNVK